MVVRRIALALVYLSRNRTHLTPRTAGLRLIPLAVGLMLSATLAAPGASGARARKPACYAMVALGAHSVRFNASVAQSRGVATLAARRYVRPLTLAQTPACAAAVSPGLLYSASLRYSSTTVAVRLVLLTHSRHGWSFWYSPAKLARASRARSASIALRPIPGGVDRVSIALTLAGRGTVQIRSLALLRVPPRQPVLPQSPPAKPPAGTPANPPAGTPAGPDLGSWEVQPGIGARGIHAILLQNGKVLIMAGSGNSLENFENKTFTSYLYDPVANTWQKLETPNDVFCSGHVQLANGNVLIVGGTKGYPPASEPLSTKYKGENASWIFNIRTDKYEELQTKNGEFHQPKEPGPLLSGAWYPSATELGNGDVISFGGLNEQGIGATATNYFTAPGNAGTDGDLEKEWVGFGSHKLQQTYGWYWGLYPSMILTADGRLFYDGSHVFGKGLDNSVVNNEGKLEASVQAPTGSSIYDFYCTPGKSVAEEKEEQEKTNPNAQVVGPNGTFPRIQNTPGLREPDHRDASAALLLPPAQEQKVMIMGGGETYETKTNAINLTDEINLKEAKPEWKAGPSLPGGTIEETGAMEPMGAGKMYVSAVALPDGTVLETGGSLLPRAQNVHEASIFNPRTNTFTPVAADPVGRDYHSEALLLPDGRVLALGSNPADGSFETRISIYTPAYLKNGPRPRLELIDNQANTLEGTVNRTAQWEYPSEEHNEAPEHTLRYSSTSPITSAVLVRPAAVTHSSDPNQREVELPISGGTGAAGEGRELKVGLPSNPNLAPPGYYMVFLVDSQGVPSAAQWVHVG